jgi:geranylgeranyl diphosphate synthase type II
MDARSRIEDALSGAFALADRPGAPPRLIAAMRYAVFPGGARIRPRLTIAVAAACDLRSLAVAASAGAAIELLHCASLVHDDMPVFDNADTRRGRPTVHRAYGAPLALLTGDALIVLAFQVLAESAARAPTRLAPMMRAIASAVGAPFGIAAGQAWECEPSPDLAAYQQAKTGALFAAATEAGAAAAGHDGAAWRPLGEYLGEAYQVADDIKDAVCTEDELGKPVGQDAALGRPNAVLRMGLNGAIDHLQALTGKAASSIPDCPGAGDLKALIRLESQRLMPKEAPAQAA